MLNTEADGKTLTGRPSLRDSGPPLTHRVK